MPQRRKRVMIRKKRSLPARLLRRALTQISSLTLAQQILLCLLVTGITGFTVATLAWDGWTMLRFFATAVCLLALLGTGARALFWRH